MVADEHSPGR
jgi:integrase